MNSDCSASIPKARHTEWISPNTEFPPIRSTSSPQPAGRSAWSTSTKLPRPPLSRSQPNTLVRVLINCAAAGSSPRPHGGNDDMKLLKCIVRPEKLEEVKEALTKMSVTGMTITDVRGHGRQKGHKAVYRGTEYSVTLLPKVEIEVVVPDERAPDILKTIISTARTGEIGDGRVFVTNIEEGYNVRTGERDVM